MRAEPDHFKQAIDEEALGMLYAVDRKDAEEVMYY
jgi:hypothetical protein